MIIRNVDEIRTAETGMMILTNTNPIVHGPGNLEHMPGVVYVPVDACIHFIDATTVKVEI